MSAVGLGSRVYVIGGWSSSGCCDPTTYYTSVEVGSVNSDGSIARWDFATDLAVGMGHGAVSTDGHHVYYAGGFGAADRATVQVADVLSDGVLSPWRLTTPLPMGAKMLPPPSQPGESMVALVWAPFCLTTGAFTAADRAAAVAALTATAPAFSKPPPRIEMHRADGEARSA